MTNTFTMANFKTAKGIHIYILCRLCRLSISPYPLTLFVSSDKVTECSAFVLRTAITSVCTLVNGGTIVERTWVAIAFRMEYTMETMNMAFDRVMAWCGTTTWSRCTSANGSTTNITEPEPYSIVWTFGSLWISDKIYFYILSLQEHWVATTASSRMVLSTAKVRSTTWPLGRCRKEFGHKGGASRRLCKMKNFALNLKSPPSFQFQR